MSNFRPPTKRTDNELELSMRARALLLRHGGKLSGDVSLPGLSIMSSIDNLGNLMIERTSDYLMLYLETPGGHVIRTSLDDDLSWALDLIKRHTVLEDLADI